MAKKEYRVYITWNTAMGGSEKKPNWMTVKYSTSEYNAESLGAVMFPINQQYDIDLQRKRAEDYAEYLNKLDEAAKVAYEQLHLVDVLKR